jgi:hypothetical protein
MQRDDKKNPAWKGLSCLATACRKTVVTAIFCLKSHKHHFLFTPSPELKGALELE